jgi:hypothetical protein
MARFGTPPAVYPVPELPATRQFCAARRTPYLTPSTTPLPLSHYTAMSLARTKDEAQLPLPHTIN